MAKLNDIRALAENHASDISRSTATWTGYPDTAATKGAIVLTVLPLWKPSFLLLKQEGKVRHFTDPGFQWHIYHIGESAT
ncbi:MAG: hypothetical protein Q4D81_13125 [Eubacteriales bacterium]|nr:hypothetical protein [Eubacteriales bacterium]